MTVFWILGTNGSGKTTIVNKLLGDTAVIRWEEFGVVFSGDPNKIAALGPYGIKIGGCDRLRNFDLMEHAITLGGDKYRNLVFEGALVSTIFERFKRALSILRGKGISSVSILLSTTLQDCLTRIKARTKNSDPNVKSMKSKTIAAFKIITRLRGLGFETEITNCDEALEIIKTKARI